MCAGGRCSARRHQEGYLAWLLGNIPPDRLTLVGLKCSVHTENESKCTHSNGTACSNGQPLGSCMQVNVEMSADLLQPLVKSLQLALLTLLELLALAAWGQARDVSLGSIY